MRSPAPEERAPGQHGAEGGGQEQVSWLDLAVEEELVEGDRDRARGGVAVALQVLEDGVAVEAEYVAGGVDDPDVGLVRDEPADVADLTSGLGQDVEGRVGQDPDRPFEDGAAVHRQVLETLGED